MLGLKNKLFIKNTNWFINFTFRKSKELIQMENSDFIEDEEMKSRESGTEEENDAQSEGEFPPFHISFSLNGSNWVWMWSNTNQESEEFLIGYKVSTEYITLVGKMEQ